MVQKISEDLGMETMISGHNVSRLGPVVIVMAKVPGFGSVKTRLAPLLDEERRISLAKCFLRDVALGFGMCQAKVLVAFSPEEGREELVKLLGSEIAMTPQKGDTLGERLQNVINEAFGLGFGPVVVIGTDSPTMPRLYPTMAIEHLSAGGNSVAIGPTDDGGYYLIGLSRPQDAIFCGVEWSTETVFEASLENIRKIGNIDLLVLPKWYDVDKPDDLLRLREEFRSGNFCIAEDTARWMIENHEIFGSASLPE